MDNYIIGMPKCGTTSIYSALLNDSRVCLGGDKEQNFFSTDIYSYKALRSGDLSDYKSKFNSSKICIDVSVNYAVSQVAPEKIYEFNSSAKVLLIFRDPEQYLKSQFKQLFYAGYEKKCSLSRSLHAEMIGDSNRYCTYKELLDYEGIVNRWSVFFPGIKVVKYEDLFKSGRSASTTVYEWLNISEISNDVGHQNKSDEKEINRYEYIIKRLGSLGLSRLAPRFLKKIIVYFLKKRGSVDLDDGIDFIPPSYKKLIDKSKEYFDAL